MAKVGLKDTLRLMAAGYSKKEIDALAAIDEEQEKDDKKDPEPDPVPPPPVIIESQPAPAPAPEDKKDPEPDYKKLYEDLKKENDKNKADLTKLQQDNVHKDSTPDKEKAAKEQQESLLSLVSSFM